MNPLNTQVLVKTRKQKLVVTLRSVWILKNSFFRHITYIIIDNIDVIFRVCRKKFLEHLYPKKNMLECPV